GLREVNGHLLYALTDDEYGAAYKWLDQIGLLRDLDAAVSSLKEGKGNLDKEVDRLTNAFMDAWEAHAGVKTYGEAVAEVLERRQSEGDSLDMTPDQWLQFARTASLERAREKADELGVQVAWDCDRARTPDGFYQIRG